VKGANFGGAVSAKGTAAPKLERDLSSTAPARGRVRELGGKKKKTLATGGGGEKNWVLYAGIPRSRDEENGLTRVIGFGARVPGPKEYVGLQEDLSPGQEGEGSGKTWRRFPKWIAQGPLQE